MSDKVNMSLDDIIRANKASKASSGDRKSVSTKQGARLSTGRGRVFAKKLVKKAVTNQRSKARRNNAPSSSTGGMIPRSEVKNIVNKAVKQAIKQSNVNIGIAGRLGGKVPRNIITATKLAQLSQRSRTIQRNRPAPVFRPRGRNFGGARAIEEAALPWSFPRPVQIVRQPVQAAPVVQVVERIREVVPRQQIRKIGNRAVVARQQHQIARVGGGGRIIRQTAPVIIRQQSQPRFVQQQVRPQQQQIIYEEAAPVVRQVVREAPIRRMQQRVNVVRQAPQQQRVQVIRQAAARVPRNRLQNVEYVDVRRPTSQVARKNAQMRDALGLGSPRHIIRETTRFEPSSSFLANRTVRARGRGFTSNNFTYL